MSETYQSGNLKVFFEEMVKVRFEIVGTQDELTVSLGRPQKDPMYNFYCPYQIFTSQENLRQHSAGTDELKSIQNAMAMINANLKRLSRDKQLILKRDGHVEGNLGFEEYEALHLMRIRGALKYDDTLSQNDKQRLEKTVLMLEDEADKRGRARFSPDMQAMREKRKRIMKERDDQSQK